MNQADVTQICTTLINASLADFQSVRMSCVLFIWSTHYCVWYIFTHVTGIFNRARHKLRANIKFKKIIFWKRGKYQPDSVLFKKWHWLKRDVLKIQSWSWPWTQFSTSPLSYKIVWRALKLLLYNLTFV